MTVSGDTITLRARGSEFAALGTTFTTTLSWPGCSEIEGSPGTVGDDDTPPPPSGPQIVIEGVSYSLAAEGAAEPADSEYGIGTSFRLVDDAGSEIVFTFPEEVIIDQFSAVARDADSFFIFPAPVNRPPGEEPGPDYDNGSIYRLTPDQTAEKISTDEDFARIFTMAVIDDTLWVAQLSPSRIIPIPLSA